MTQTILVTGGAGYIGTHTVKALQEEGFQIIVLDNLIHGHRDLIETTLQAHLIIGDIGDRLLLNRIFSEYTVDAVMHLAAYAYVGESVKNPAKYYRNNVIGTLTLLQAMLDANVKTLVFSSTCATYGIPHVVPITEDHPQNPTNPYGKSKWMVEQVLTDFDQAYGLKSVCLRYFNAAGADPSGQLGEDHTPETHLIPLALQVALGHQEAIAILGTDYPTPDGTCIRDFIHVSDLARAHVLGLQYLLKGGDSQTFNLSNGSGFSVREVIETTKTVTGQDIPVVDQPRRPGDPPVLVGNSSKALQMLGWSPRHRHLESIIRHAWTWHQARHGVALSPANAVTRHHSVSTKPTPTVSVVVPAYNAEEVIARTLLSLRVQTYGDFEILVVDDGSRDRTPEIVRTLAQEDPRIRLLQQPNAGVAAARNLGIQEARGEFIAPVDADDLWYPEAMAKLIHRFQVAPPEVGVVYAWSVDIDEQDHPIGGFHAARVEGNVYKTLICHNFLGNASSTLIRAACLRHVGGYDPQLKAQRAQGCEDWDLYLRLAEFYEFAVVPDFLVGYRKVTGSMSGDFSQMARSQALMLQAVQRKHPEIPGFLYRVSRSSFYLYLAHQCDLQGHSSATRQWLWQAVNVDPITPLGRLGWYSLFMSSLVQDWTAGEPQTTASASLSPSLVQEPQGSSGAAASGLPSFTQADINAFKLWLKVFVGNVLHQSLLRV